MGIKLRNIQCCFLLKLFLGFIFLFNSNQFFSQFTISKKYTPSGIVNQVLKSNGVEVFNVSYTGDYRGIGTFTSKDNSIGFNEGLILSTGNVLNAPGPNKFNGTTTNRSALSTAFYKKGYSLLGNNSKDAAVLEFDFIPQGDTVEFEYVFASEEYPEFVNNIYNDIFGFFISGPGINGFKNIAVLPDGNPVAINNVNQFKNTQYYISNDNGKYIEYDGYTVVLKAKAIVKCGQKFHLILAIADVGDNFYDSAIFIKAKSLSVKSDFESMYSVDFPYFEGDTLAEICNNVDLKISRSTKLNNKVSNLNVSISGSSIVDKDYSNTIPNNFSFNIGENEKHIKFSTLYDKETDSLDSIIITISGSDLCVPINYKFYIKNVDPLEVSLPNDTMRCQGKPLTLKPIVKGGLPSYSYSWSTGSFDDTISVFPSVPTNYSVTIKDQCVKKPITVTNNVYIPSVFIPLKIIQPDDIVEICPYKPTYILINVSKGGGAYKYSWYADDSLFSSIKLDTLKPSKTTNYKILITDRCGDTISTKFKYTITSPPLLSVLSGDTLMCYRDSTLLKVNATGGYGDYTYSWSNSSSISDTSYANELYTTWYYSYVGDQCKTFEVKDSILVNVLRPLVDFEIVGDPVVNSEIKLFDKSRNATKFNWYLNNVLISNDKQTSFSVNDSSSYAIKLEIKDDFGCTNDTTFYKIIYYTPSVYIPNAFTPNGNLFNNIFYPVLTSIKEIDFMIYNRWGELIFSSTDLSNCYWDGTYKGRICSNDVYIYKLKTISVTNEKKEFVGHISLIR
jgi:gliding motility-associated-like protein